jgi:hypothetical protein
MAGFKEGTVNGWDEEDTADPESGSDPKSDTAGADDTAPDAVPGDATSDVDTASGGGDTTASDIPWLLRRNSITDGREQTVQLHLQADTTRVQRTQKSVIEGRLGERVRKADLREAALLVGLQHTDDIVEVLEEWGYAVTSSHD